MSRYGIVESGFWQNPKVKALTDTEALMLVYLFSNPHSNSIGCYLLPAGYIAADRPQWSAETVSGTIAKLSRNGLVERDEETGLTRIVGWFGHNPPANPNAAESMLKIIDTLPTVRAKANLIKAMIDADAKHLRPRHSDLAAKLETVSKRLRNGSDTSLSDQTRPDQYQDQTNTRPDHPLSANAAPVGSFSKKPSLPPKSSGVPSKPIGVPKYARRIEGGFETALGEFVSFEDAFWALKDAAAGRDIAESVMGLLLSAHDGKAALAYDALILAIKKEKPVSYVGKVISNRQIEARHAKAAADGQGIAIPGDPAAVAPWVLRRRAEGEVVTWNPKRKYWEAGGRGYDDNENEVAG